MKLKLVVLGLSAVATALSLHAQAIVDDFSDANDEGWAHYEPIGLFGGVGSYTFPEGGYRIQAAPSPSPDIGSARAGSFRPDFDVSDFLISFDVLDFDAAAEQFFGGLVRANNLGFGTTTGYALGYDNGLAKVLSISRITGEVDTLLASTPTTLDPEHDYRFVLRGQGQDLFLSVFDLSTPLLPQASVQANDANYTSGIFGLLVFDTTDVAGAFADTTFDNVLAQVPEPSATALSILAAGTLLFLHPRPRKHAPRF
jgi:hypothetical protein